MKKFLKSLLHVFNVFCYEFPCLFQNEKFDSRFINEEEREKFELIVSELIRTRDTKPTKVIIGGKETKIVVLS